MEGSATADPCALVRKAGAIAQPVSQKASRKQSGPWALTTPTVYPCLDLGPVL